MSSGAHPHSPEPEPPGRRRPRRRAKRVAFVAAVVAVAVGGAAAGWALFVAPEDDTSRADAAPAESSTTAEPTTTTTRPKPTTTTTTTPKLVQPAAVQLPAPPGGRIGYGSSGDVVRLYEQRMQDLKFDPGAVDGVFDQETSYAVQSVQKVLGLPVTGTIDGTTALGLAVFKYPARLVKAHPEPDRVEISLDRQTLTLYKGFQVALITTTSTGDGDHFCGGDDGCQYAVTPPGKFHFTWHYRGWKKGKLGTLWNPYYFNGGIAVHGYSSVPTYPASHGCARIPMYVANYFPDLVYKGMAVYVLGQPPELPPGVEVENPDPTPPAPPTTPAPTTAPPVTTAPPTTQPATTTTKPVTTTTKPKPTTTTAAATTTTTAP